MGRPPSGRGASLPAIPCFFVAGHHVFEVGWADRRVGVVLPSPLALVSSSRGTTSLGPNEPTAGWTWCSPPSPCSFVTGHHVLGAGRADRRADVVLHSPQTLVPSLPGTTPLGPNEPTAGPAWCFRGSARSRIQKVMHEPLFSHPVHQPGFQC